MLFMTEEQKLKYPRSYRFDVDTIGNERVNIKKDGDEPDFVLNEKLRLEVYRGMPSNLPVEAKALFIYYRICKILNYDEKFIYSSKFNGSRDYGTEFNKEKLESIEPGSSIICSDFCRIYKKFLDELGPEIECVAFSYGDSGTSHWSVGFFTDKFSLEMDPIDVNDETGYSDLVGIKTGMWPVGIKPSSFMTKENVDYLVKLMDEMYTLATGEYAKDYEDLIDLLKEVPDNQKVSGEKLQVESNPESSVLYGKIEAFMEMLKNRGISGNEAIVTFMTFDSDFCFFGEDMKNYSFAWQHNDAGENNKYTRKCLIQGIDGSIHSVDFNQEVGKHVVYNGDEFKKLIESGKIKYENEKYQILLED